MNSIHISQARAMLDTGRPVDLTVVKLRDGSLIRYTDVVSLRYDYYKGTRSIKILANHSVRTIHDVCIIGINEFEVYL